MLGATMWLKALIGLPDHGYLTRDTTAIASLPPYAGLLSTFGFFLWAAAGAIAAFAGWILHVRRDPRKGLRNFLLVSGILTLLLGLDDAFLIHDDIIPIRLGLKEWPFLLAFPAVTLFVLVKSWAVILLTDYLLLGLALGMLGLSLLIDLHSALFDNMPILGVDHFLAEDGTKFIGMVAWLCYFWRTAASGVLHMNIPAHSKARIPAGVEPGE